MPDRDVILHEALLLSQGGRVMRVDALEESFDHATPQIAAAWSEEIDRHLAAYHRGETQSIREWSTSTTRWPNSVRRRL